MEVGQMVTLDYSLTQFKPRVHNTGASLVNATLAFGSWEYLFYWLRPLTVWLLIALVGAGLSFQAKKLPLVMMLTLPFLYLKIGTSEWNHVWGVLYVPGILIGCVWVLDLAWEDIRGRFAQLRHFVAGMNVKITNKRGV
jgi:hypothetical protein